VIVEQPASRGHDQEMLGADRRDASPIGMSRVTSLFLALALFAGPLAGNAQPPARVPRVGYVGAGSTATAGHHARAFAEALRQHGYVEGQNIAIEYRWAEGKLERLPALVADLVRLRVDVIVSSATPAIRAAKEQTKTIPIVMAGVTHPVGAGFIASLAQPGGNITGLTHLHPDLAGKRLELLKELLPGLSRVAVLWNPNHPGQPRAFRDTQVAAQALQVTLMSMEARNREQLDAMLLTIGSERPQALLELVDPLTFYHRGLIAEAAARHKVPAMYGFKESAEIGGLMSYGTDFADLFRRAADYVAKILKGAKPAELPVAQPTKFEFVINLKTARALGLAMPASLLLRADQVIE
jgi:putative tryptophan/tyrosine transport system substrate-binding protein